MSISTKVKTEYLNKYCKKNLNKWREKISPNIVGVHVGYKKCNNRETKRFSIIFHVIQKLGYPISHIPKRISIGIHKNKISVPTDVIETGSMKLLNIQMGDKARSRTVKNEFGAAGLFISIDEDIYVVSNMHVLAPQRIAEQIYRCPKDEQFSTDVECFNEQETERAYLEKAELRETDLAMARFQNPKHATLRIKKLGHPTVFLKEPEITNDMSIQMFGANSNRVLKGAVKAKSVSKTLSYDSIEITFNNLIATTLSVIEGDSGSVVIDDFLQIVGILVGKDEEFAYVIPSFEIENFIQTT